MITIEIPGASTIHLLHVVFDVNGTLTCEGNLIDGVERRIGAVKRLVTVHLASADTYGVVDSIAQRLDVVAVSAPEAADKLHLLMRLGPAATAHVGNGSNDVAALRAAALGIAVIGPEGASAAALRAADVVFPSINDALDALLHARRLTATLRRGP